MKYVRIILLILFVVVVSTPTILFFAINSEWLQNSVTQRITTMLSEKLGNHFSVGHIRLSGFNRVTVHDLLVTDQRGDTILRAPELIGRLSLLAISSRNIELRKVELNRADIRFANDPETDEINIKFLVDQLKSTDTTSNKAQWMFGIRAIELNDCRFMFRDKSKTFDKPFGMNFTDLDVSNLNLVASHFHPGDSLGGVEFRIRRLSCHEKCGFDLQFMSADFAINRNNLSFKNVRIVTSLSEIDAKDASFQFDSFQDFSGGQVISNVFMSMDIRSSEVAFSDLSQFVPYFGTYSGKAIVTGKVTGTVENMKGEKMNIFFGDVTQISGNFDLKGLPNIRSTLIYADITYLETCPTDIEKIQTPRSSAGHVTLSETMHRFSTLRFKGNFTGFYDDFVTYGKFTTNLGNLSTDVSIKPTVDMDSDTSFTFRGKLQTEQFHLGKFLTKPSIGDVTLTGMVEGLASVRGNIHAQLEGAIESISLKGYEYRDIAINGAVNNRMYDGKLTIDEPNIKMDFSGKVDLTEAIPAYDFWANVERARLHELKLVETDTSSFVAFKIQAAFSGSNIDNLSGDLDLTNALFRRNSREIEINDLLLFTKSIRDTNNFILRSDILDAEIRGEYQFLKLSESFLSMVKNYAPAWAPASANPDSLSLNSFRFNIKFKDTQKLTNFFANEFRVSRNTKIEGTYNPAQRDVHFVMDVPFMRLGDKQWQGFFINGSIEDSTFIVEAGCSAFRMNKNLTFDNLTLLTQTRGDSIGVRISWNNWDSLLNRGYLNSTVFFQKKPEHRMPLTHITSQPGRIIASGNSWALMHDGITVDSSAIHFSNIRASRGDQKIQFSGVVSKREEDTLNIAVQELNLTILNEFLKFDKLLFGGIANGSATLSNLYAVPVFIADLQVDDFSLNNSPFGNTHLNASWNSFNRSVHIEAESILNNWRTLLATGNYFISDRKLNFDVSLGKVPIRILQPYIDNIFTGIEGAVTSEMKLTGTIDKPLLNGTIELQNAALTLDYTKTRYDCSGVATMKDNVISFKNIVLFDRKKNSCKITDGYLNLDNFKNISYDMQFQANNLEVLNTELNDNSLFYGKAFATGEISIRGNTQDMLLNIKAKTERNTQFFLPLTSNDEIAQSSFITFVDHTPRAQRRLDLRRRRVADTSDEPLPEQKFEVNINLDLTPDAEAQLIFDAKIGDVLRARGKGNIVLNIANNRFDMTGTYTIEDGDYLFTLQSLLSGKHFTIEKGGVITWSGDPLGALLNIKAIYKANPSLYDLMNDENFRRSIPVECILYITNILTNPNIRFELDMPTASQEVRSFLDASTNSEEEMAQQILFLLAANRFYPNFNQPTRINPSGSGLEMGLASAYEFLSSQLSHMLSGSDYAVDFTVRPGTFNTGQHYGMGIRTDSWNFQYNYEVSTERAENMGEFYFDMKVPKSNKLRFKVFNRANATYLSQNPYTQGIGLLYRQDFNHLRDLFKRKKTSAIRRDEEEEAVKNEQVILPATYPKI